jgi:pilus assembly protein FimV
MVLSPIRTLRVARVNIPVSLLRLVLAAALALPVLAQAAGLGRLTVQSFLGQPLRAEIEVVSLQAGEESSLEARLASGNAFAQAGIEFNAALNGMRFAVDKRGGKPVILVTTRQPVNEPFLDVLVELRWATGLFVREYTILLDPPGYEGPKPQPAASAPAVPAATASPAPSAGATGRAPPGPSTSEIAPAPRVEGRPMESAAAPEQKPESSQTTKTTETAPAEGAAASSAPAAPSAGVAAPVSQGPQTYEVKKGDTLGEIALRYRPAGISYHQMLIALQRANEDAFIRDNINLVRAGRILTIPDAEAAAAVDRADANRLVFAQHADFADYRARLAGVVAAAPSAPKPAEQSAAGPISVQPESPKPAARTDQLKLSRADAKKPGAAAATAARADDLAAKQRALDEAQSRVTELEKNVTDLQKLLEIRNQQLAQLQEKANAKPAPTVPAAAPTPAKPAAAAPEAPKPAAAPEAPKPAAAPEAPKPAAATQKPAAAAPEVPKPAAQAPKPAAAAPKPPAAAPAKPKPRPKPRPIAPPPPEPGFLDEFLEDPTLALGGVAVVLLLLGGYGYWAWQRKKKSVAKFKDSVLGSASLAPAADAAGPVSVSQASVTQSTAGGVDADDVDPIAEADVYMAYGRDAQAEEILREALQRDPNRLAVHAKLLEIYANRRDAQAFEQTALKLKGATGGTGPEWDKAMALGRSIDPGNGLYGGAGETTPTPVPAFAAAAAAAPAVDFDIGGGGGPAEPTSAAAPAVDLDISGPTSAPAAEERSDFSPSGTLIIDNEDSKAASNGLDFDLGGGDKAPEVDAGGGLNFELPATAAEAPAAAEPAPSGGGLDFDLNLGGGGESKETSAPALDLSAISLDLGTPGETPAAGGGNGNGGDPKWQEVATKLDLAKAYEEMGDKDGARELLNEVLREGDSAQQGQANQLLAKLG